MRFGEKFQSGGNSSFLIITRAPKWPAFDLFGISSKGVRLTCQWG